MNFSPATYDDSASPNTFWLVVLTVVVAAAAVFFAYHSDRAKGAQRKRLLAATTIGMLLTIAGIFSVTFIPVSAQIQGSSKAADATIQHLQKAASDTYGLQLSKVEARKLLGSAAYGGKLPKTHLYGHILDSKSENLKTVNLVRKNGRWLLASAQLTELAKS